MFYASEFLIHQYLKYLLNLDLRIMNKNIVFCTSKIDGISSSGHVEHIKP